MTSARVQALARIGATGGLLTPREIKEICQAVVAGAEDGAPKASKPRAV